MIENASEALYELGIELDVVGFVLSGSAGAVVSENFLFRRILSQT
jgi:hypothetical protein